MTHDPDVIFNRLLARGRLRHLQLLASVAEAGSLQRAAPQVGMSQPAATQALADLEELLGSPLFERHARGVRLTRFGEAVVPVARNILQALRASTETLVSLQAGAQDFLRLGAIPAAANALLADVLPAFLSRHPGLRIELIEESSGHLLPELAAGRLDALLCRRPREPNPRWHFEALAHDRSVLVVASGHPFASLPAVPFQALVGVVWILPHAGMGVRLQFDDLWAGEPERPLVHPLTTTSLSVILQVLRLESAVCLIPASIARPLLQAGLLAVLQVADGRMPGALDDLGLLTNALEDPAALRELRAALQVAGGLRRA